MVIIECSVLIYFIAEGHTHPPPRALVFHSTPVAWQNVLPVRKANTASNLWATKEHKIGHKSSPQHLNAQSGGMCACIPCPPGVAAYALMILTEKTSLTLGVIGKMYLITVISSRHLPYLCTQDGVSLGFPQTT